MINCRAFLLCLLMSFPMVTIGAQEILARSLEKHLSSANQLPLAVNAVPLRAQVTLRRFFADRVFRPAWTGDAARPLLEELTTAIGQAGAHGLSTMDYHQAALGRAVAANDAFGIELLATDAYFTLAAHLLRGRLDPVKIEPDWTASHRERDLVRHLENALAKRRIRASLDDLEPNAPAYALLKDALALYRQAEHDGGWQAIDPGPALKLGEAGPRVVALKKRLQATGLLASVGASLDSFDLELETAVAAFQRRIGIEADGVVGAVTLGELNKGSAERIAQIRANLERWRWLPEDLGSRHIRVNIADFRLEARRNKEVEQSHDVIVGRAYRKTPVFSGDMSYIVLNPWWDTPDSLARQDKLPVFKKDPTIISRMGYQVLDRSGKSVDVGNINWDEYNRGHFPFRLRQSPGPQNALGQVKLMFPNKHNVYLHDTPSRELFARSNRAFSSGCVRVADALGLTEWVLQETPEWSRDRMNAVLASGRETRVNLAASVPVHILYFTAVAEPDGSLRLINDLYQRDARLITALNRGGAN